jgi:hypothetical protein
MTEPVIAALVARYGWMFVASNMFWPVYRDFVQGVTMGLLGL